VALLVVAAGDAAGGRQPCDDKREFREPRSLNVECPAPAPTATQPAVARGPSFEWELGMRSPRNPRSAV
jgi:hypothetical protein